MEKAESKRGRKRKNEEDVDKSSLVVQKGKKKTDSKSKEKIEPNSNSNSKSKSTSKLKDKINTQTSIDNFFNINTSNTSLFSSKNNKNNINEDKVILQKEATKEILIKGDTNLEGKEIKIYSWNVNGFRALMSKGEIESFINKENPDILCFNETKIDDKGLVKEKYETTFQEFSQYWNCCKTKGGYSGVAVFTKIKPLNVIYGINNKAYDGEGRVLTLEFENYYLVSVYVPNSGEGLKRLDYRTKEWDVEFMKFLDNLKKIKDVVLCGDLNVAHNDIDIFQPKGHLKYAGFTLKERDNFTKFLKSGYIDSYRHIYPKNIKFSYFSARFGKKNLIENKGWRLDYFVINNNSIDRLVNSEILNEYDASDHSPIKLTWKI